MIMPTTTTSGTGNLGANRRPRRIAATTKAESASESGLNPDSPVATSQSCASVLCEGAATPSISPSIATPTWTPTPVRNPTSAVRDRKSARKPSLKMRAISRSPAVSRVSMPTSAMYFSPPIGAMRESALEKIAAVAESAATTRWREEPNRAKPTSGRSTV